MNATITKTQLNKAITFESVGKAYVSLTENRQVLSDISFSVVEGERVAIVGANGSGKSTILQIAAGMIRPDRGKVNRQYPLGTTDTGYIPQDYRNALFPWMRLSEHVKLLARPEAIKTKEDLITLQEEVTQALARIGIRAPLDKYPYQLSGGEQQICLFVLTLLRRPRFIIADESFSAVDVHRREAVFGYFTDFLERQRSSLLFVDHDLEHCLLFADRVLVLSKQSETGIADIVISQPHPRDLEWRYEDSFRQILKEVVSWLR
jgi:NitT/TauT family transport system ATP-binding protein